MAKQVSPGVLALRKVVDDVYADAREAKKQGKLVGWSSSKFPCELAEAFDLNVMYPENQAAGIAAQRDGEIMCQAAEDLGFDNDICGYARISLAYAAGKRASRKFDPETLEFIIDPNSGKPLKDENGKVVIDPETGKPKKDPKTQVPYTVLDDIHEIEALPETTEKVLHTHDRFKYGRNLLIFACISEIPWNFAQNGTLLFADKQNVFFTLFLGYLAFCLIDRFKENPTMQLVSMLALLAVSYFLKADYGYKGYVFLLIMFWLHQYKPAQALIGSCWLIYEWKACFAFISLNMYNGRRGFIRGKWAKYFFYAFYPVHIAILVIIRKKWFGI